MSFLKRLLGLKPTREEFAQLMLRAMADAGDAAWRFDQGDYALRHAKDARVFFLANAFAEYCSAPRDQRAPMVKRLTQIQLVDSPDMALETVRWSVLPRVRERLYFEMVRLTTLMMGKAAAQHHVPLADAVSVAFCVDFPDRILELNAETLRGWSISTQELSQLALHNLRQRSENTFVPVAPGVFASRWRDNHDASRILLTHEIERLGVKGHPVATIPNRDHLIITGSQDVAGLQTLITATGKILEEPRPMLAVPFILQDGAWAAFRPPADHPLHATIEQAWLDTRLMEYAEQKSLMDKLHEKDGTDVFVATLSAIRKKDGAPFTYSVWTRDVRTLLPRSACVVLISGESGQEPIMVPWDDVARVAGHLMTPVADGYPARFEVARFPESEALEQLKRCALPPG